jgi:mRNA interferase RelE/StbE
LGIEVPCRLRYHPDVKEKDLPKLNRNIQKRIKTAIEQRLLVSPEKYSEPLRRTLKGYRKLRVGDYRIVLKLERDDILILGICHRKDVYERMEWRIQ